MKISINNPMSWVIKCNLKISNWRAADRMPKSLCSFFWTFVIASIVQVINFPALILAIFSKEFRKDPGATGSALTMLGHPLINGLLFLFSLGNVLGYLEDHTKIILSWYDWIYVMPLAMLAGFIILGTVIGVFVIIVYSIERVYRLYKGKRKEKTKRPDSWDFNTLDDYHKAQTKWRQDREAKEEAKRLRDEQKTFYIIKQWFKSNKEKACPIIEYKD